MITKFILGTKSDMSHTFTDNGERIPVTKIHTAPCYVVGIRSKDSDGYWAVQLAFGSTKNIKKPRQGILKKAGVKAPLRFLREIRLDAGNEVAEISLVQKGKKQGIKINNFELYEGDELNPKVLFDKGDKVDVTGVSKGKGFQGVVKRHGFKGGPKTHGQSDRERAPGSIGMSATPGRVFKGKKMPGRMGGDTTTIQNLEVVETNDGELLIKGLVPGPKGTLIMLRSASPVPEQKQEAEDVPEEKSTHEVKTEENDKQVAEKAEVDDKKEAEDKKIDEKSDDSKETEDSKTEKKQEKAKKSDKKNKNIKEGDEEKKDKKS